MMFAYTSKMFLEHQFSTKMWYSLVRVAETQKMFLCLLEDSFRNVFRRKVEGGVRVHDAAGTGKQKP